MDEPLRRHWDQLQRAYAAPVSERQEMFAEEMEEFAAEIRSGAVTVVNAPAWTDNHKAPGVLRVEFTRARYTEEETE